MRRFIRDLASLSLDLDLLFGSGFFNFLLGVVIYGLLALIFLAIFVW
jgi:tetrahydromethanopterin S-methyltransferase subunit B